MTWRDKAVCYNDENSSYWVSYNLEKVKYAKQGCSRCPVEIDCLMSATEDEYIVGVVAGLSEFDRLILANKERGE